MLHINGVVIERNDNMSPEEYAEWNHSMSLLQQDNTVESYNQLSTTENIDSQYFLSSTRVFLATGEYYYYHTTTTF